MTEIITDAEDDIPDFTCSSTEHFPALLREFGLSLIFTSYQAGRVIMVRSDGKQLHLSVKAFPRPMGLAVDNDRVVLGINSQLLDFRRFDAVAPDLDPPGMVDACFVPRSSHITGMINVHDIAWGDEGLWVVNSQFSCLSLIQSDFSFVPRWKPSFISDLVPEDRCHLNGMAMRDGKPRYVTSFTNLDNPEAWRQERTPIGLLMDVATNEVLASSLFMPHSPRYYQNKVYYCNSGCGELCCFDPVSGENQVLLQLPGFTRGIAFYGPLMFLGTSRTRNSDVQSQLPLNDRDGETEAGIWVIDLETHEPIAKLIFSGDIHQIYDIGVFSGLAFPDLLQLDDELVKNIFDYPGL